MTYVTIIILALIMALSYVSVIIFTKAKLKVLMLIGLTLLWITAGTISFNYLTNQQFRVSIDLKFKNVTEHKDLSEKGNPPLPLPPHTAFAYRYSEKGAVYYTALPKDEILRFYESVAEQGGLHIELNESQDSANLKLTHRNIPYSIEINKNTGLKAYRLRIDSKNK